ncbi:hypothetical protein F5Y16DRAFT_397654 [Xylariaceae sp. FL0255]|nr:hypothetical protein F5Y16DRAFT_397654 [Xylariaceae sp. FL0255]
MRIDLRKLFQTIVKVYAIMLFLSIIGSELAREMARVQFTVRFNGGAMGIQRSMRAQEVDTARGDDILANISSWSGGAYSARRHRQSGIVFVTPTNNEPVSSGANAANVIQNMLHVIIRNTGNGGNAGGSSV